jgi:hypothetical protein
LGYFLLKQIFTFSPKYAVSNYGLLWVFLGFITDLFDVIVLSFFGLATTLGYFFQNLGEFFQSSGHQWPVL